MTPTERDKAIADLIRRAAAHDKLHAANPLHGHTAPPAPVLGPIFGLAAHPMWYGRYLADFDRMKAAGLTYLRMNVGWRHLEPFRGVKDLDVYVTTLDKVIAAAKARGFTISITVIETPTWINSNIWTPPPPADYASIMGWLAARYRGKVAAWEVWNEPNLPASATSGFWASGTTDRARNSAQYAALLKAAYPAIKAADPAALVLGGSVLYNDTAWLAGLTASGAPMDALAIHPYALGHGPDDRSETYWCLRCQIEGMHARTGMNLWITEVGYQLGLVTETTRTAWMPALVAACRSYPYVKAVALYTDDYTDGLAGWAVLDSSGNPLPAWNAYVAAVRS